jgi:hypothetical protein
VPAPAGGCVLRRKPALVYVLIASLRLLWEVTHCFFSDWDWIGLDWIGLDWIGLDWIGLDWIGLDWIGLEWIGLDWIGLDWIGLDCSDCDCFFFDCDGTTNKYPATFNNLPLVLT